MRAFFQLAAQSPPRQQAFRQVVVAHLTLLAGGAAFARGGEADGGKVLLGHLLLLAGIVEGAVLLGWRLTQLPKSQALEFLLVTLLRPGRVFLAEALVGLARLALTTLAGLPVLVLLTVDRHLQEEDVIPLLLMPFTWGALAGLVLAVWAYEPVRVRRWGERVALGLIVLQLAVGALAGEHLKRWLELLPEQLGDGFALGLMAFHRYNPFAVLRLWLEDRPAAWSRLWGMELAALAVLGALLLRGAGRLQGHFRELHYQEKAERRGGRAGSVNPRLAGGGRPSFSFALFPFVFREGPLAWWAVRRVTKYSGRINLWLAGGFGVLYALYTLAGPHWPTWLGRQVFLLFDQFGGVPVLATGLLILAAVPAAFQYGLWDASAPDRCRRLELLLLTDLHGADYWNAAAAAAWRRGRGYFAVAALLWAAAALAGQVPFTQAAAALTVGALLWGLYFALGFRAFTRGEQANGLGMLLALGLPLLAAALYATGQTLPAALVPVGSVYGAGTGKTAWTWLTGAVLTAALLLVIARRALADCDAELRRWYERHHGRKGVT
jgi:hypothetical protein